MGFFGKLSSRLSSVIPCVAAAAACVASFPHPTDAAFVTGGGKLPDCDTATTGPFTCGNAGTGIPCDSKRQRCKIPLNTAVLSYLCDSEGGSESDCFSDDDCQNEKHDATKSTCNPVTP